MTMHARNILFDLDGTISDPKEGITKSIAYALEQMDKKAPPLEELAEYIGPPLRQTFEILLETTDREQTERGITLYRQRYNTAGKGMTENYLYQNIPEILSALQGKGKRLYIATSKAQSIAAKIIDHFALGNIFHAVYGASLDGTRSDKGELLEYILLQEGITPDDAVMVGDRKHDIIGATKNNLKSIGVLWGYGSQEELRTANATVLCNTPKDMLDMF